MWSGGRKHDRDKNYEVENDSGDMDCFVDGMDRSATNGGGGYGERYEKQQSGKGKGGEKTANKRDAEKDTEKEDTEEDWVIPHRGNTFGVRFDEEVVVLFPSSKFWQVSTEGTKVELAGEEASHPKK